MLRKIPVDQLRLGMHLHAFEGSWINHPFWRTRFVIDSAAQLDAVRRSGVAECWIDPRLGLDVQDDAITMPPPARPPPAAAPVLPDRAEPAAVSAAFSEELEKAAAICRRGREQVASMFAEARMGRTIDAEACLPLVEDISRSVERNAGALVSLARLKTRDDYTYMHSVAVCALMVALARRLGHDDAACRQAGLAGLVHDIGKALMPADVLQKPGALTDDEMGVMRTHPERGHALLAETGSTPASALEVTLHHHERVDGRGYPHGLAGERLTLLARMGAVCDVYDAITSNRPYKAGWDPAESIARMASWTGHFDKAVLEAFVHSLGIYPTGSIVRLQSGRIGVVVEQNASALTAPVVRAFFSTKSQLHITPERIDLARPGCHDRIVAREGGAAAQFRHADELWADPEVLRKARA
ncbi:MAG: HD-GYP domain-containing protein [Comamonadaceae bacterium]|nr:HD-GYP domain-containing protein [Comamonadaceae bacterium]